MQAGRSVGADLPAGFCGNGILNPAHDFVRKCFAH
jgi:hypothetical protein